MTRLFAGTPFDIPPECELCGQVESECQCTAADKAAAEQQRDREAARLPPEKQRARVRLEQRKGKRRVTVVEGLSAEANDLPDLLSRLQAACGTGGTVKAKEDLIELQGDHLDTAKSTLKTIGYRV
ncbi:translation initiation factor [Roseimaritima sediminicola]|uniref:translation initiation factor n=1 Tax=Roseimaritima sediminicola TaxID=2662066 RepID=UPI00129831FE|nr:translation initiation factor [Roseimaritima sediminicola]